MSVNNNEEWVKLVLKNEDLVDYKWEDQDGTGEVSGFSNKIRQSEYHVSKRSAHKRTFSKRNFHLRPRAYVV
jgi:hypothetical protein